MCIFLRTFPCLAHGPSVSATLTLVVHPKRPHFATLGEDTCMGLTHGNLSYKVAFQICHLTWRQESGDLDKSEEHKLPDRNIFRQANVFTLKESFISLYQSREKILLPLKLTI